MTAFRSALASVLLAVLAVGGVVLPSAHRAAHGLEIASARAAHVAHHELVAHGDAAHEGTDPEGPLADAPCPPPPNDVDCAICIGLSAAADLAAAPAPLPEDDAGTHAAYADWLHMDAAAGAGARAPPLG